MAEQVAHNNAQNDGRKFRKSPDAHILPGAISRERSFIRTTNNQQNANKRRSLAFHQQQQPNNQHQIRGGKPAMEIYRPPKINYNLQHSSSSSIIFPTPGGGHILQQTKSNASLHQQMQHLAAAAAANRHSHGGGMTIGNMHHSHHPQQQPHHHQRAILVTHPMQMGQMGGVGVSVQSSQLPLVNSPSSGNILHQTNSHRVKFAAEPQIQKHHMNNHQQILMNNNTNYQSINNAYNAMIVNPLQRSKSLSSADPITRSIAGLGLGLGNESAEIGIFPPDVQALIDSALEDPNQLNARCLMELANHVMQRAVEGRRYALPVSRLCISIIAKEHKETFLEALLNNCRQWYQEREKILYSIQGMKSPSRTRFTAFMAFLTEMFCQLKRRQLQLRTQCDGAPPPLVLLTLLSMCCEDCVKPPVRSLSEIECLFFVLTCIGRDLETQLAQQLECLLASVRDAFLNSSASAPAIRRTLLQLIELHASNWQLPGNTVLYYYPSSK